MSIREKLDDNDLALVDVLEDPIFCVEFLRSTKDGSIQKEAWPKQEFSYRHYQRALISDRSEKIAILGGRAVGKCQPLTATIYTTQGYENVYQLRKKKVFEVWCLDENGKHVQRRAVLAKDKFTKTFRITTESGYEVLCTEEHPILTPDGYVKLKDLQSGDMVAVSTQLPWNSENRLWRWHELRYMGYMLLQPTWRSETWIVPRFQRIREELRRIADLSNSRFVVDGEQVSLMRKVGKDRSLMRKLSGEIIERTMYYLVNARAKNELRFVPKTIMHECLDHIRYFLEAVFAQFATLRRNEVFIDCITRDVANDIQELLLRFGIETRIDQEVLHLRDERAVYRFYTTFELPGVKVENITPPPASLDYSPIYRFEPITSITVKAEREITYALYVYDFHNYISGHVHTHNSLFLEDRFVYKVLNQDIEFPETKEMLLATQNQSQLEPIQGRLITRFTTSRLLKDFLQNRINRSLGIFDFRFGDTQFLLRSRIAGNDGKQNMVGLHLPDMTIDEGQVFTVAAWNELIHAWNSWEKEKQIVIAGVSNGLRNTLLYHADKKLSGFKRYYIPAHSNPYYTRDVDLENLRQFGGEDSDEYQQQVLGRHGTAAFSVLNRDQIKTSNLELYRFRYTGNELQKGISYTDHLDRVKFDGYEVLAAGIDCGFVDPTIITIVGLKDGIWYLLARYVIQRIDFTRQEKIINWLDEFYHFDIIGIDIGSGGGGSQMLHSFLYREEYRSKNYEPRIIPVQFGERVTVGYNSDGKELAQTTKTLGAELLVQHIQNQTLHIPQYDHEAISQLERITKQKGMNGDDKYFILSEKGNGAASDDHLFASLICWAIATRDMSFQKRKRKKLGKSSGKTS